MDMERIEQGIENRNLNARNTELIFASKGSAGNNPLRLAQICSTFDFVIGLLGWEKKPLANLSKFLTEYQASIDAKYHDDFKEVCVAEEIERKRAERKGISILAQ